MSEYKTFYPTAVKQCGCGAGITLAASDLLLPKMLTEWRETHRHEEVVE